MFPFVNFTGLLQLCLDGQVGTRRVRFLFRRRQRHPHLVQSCSSARYRQHPHRPHPRKRMKMRTSKVPAAWIPNHTHPKPPFRLPKRRNLRVYVSLAAAEAPLRVPVLKVPRQESPGQWPKVNWPPGLQRHPHGFLTSCPARYRRHPRTMMKMRTRKAPAAWVCILCPHQTLPKPPFRRQMRMRRNFRGYLSPAKAEAQIPPEGSLGQWRKLPWSSN